MMEIKITENDNLNMNADDDLNASLEREAALMPAASCGELGFFDVKKKRGTLKKATKKKLQKGKSKLASGLSICEENKQDRRNSSKRKGTNGNIP